mmetsp:Transcript_29606/g.49111  ORF Transcript_29606/g.49111 Transcript_29606/m.49111 type:complete len:122 (+) Transcript_29606:94-459(+)
MISFVNYFVLAAAFLALPTSSLDTSNPGLNHHEPIYEVLDYQPFVGYGCRLSTAGGVGEEDHQWYLYRDVDTDYECKEICNDDYGCYAWEYKERTEECKAWQIRPRAIQQEYGVDCYIRFW